MNKDFFVSEIECASFQEAFELLIKNDSGCIFREISPTIQLTRYDLADLDTEDLKAKDWKYAPYTDEEIEDLFNFESVYYDKHGFNGQKFYVKLGESTGVDLIRVSAVETKKACIINIPVEVLRKLVNHFYPILNMQLSE